MLAAATGITLTVTIAMIRMVRTDIGRRLDDTNSRITDLRAETRDAHAQIGKRIDDTNTRIGRRVDDTNARITDLRADFRTLFPHAAEERPEQ